MKNIKTNSNNKVVFRIKTASLTNRILNNNIKIMSTEENFTDEYFASKPDSYFEELDKRTKEYKLYKEWKDNLESIEVENSIIDPSLGDVFKDFEADLEEDETSTPEEVEVVSEDFKNKSVVPTEVYNEVMSFKGRIPGDRLKWLFNQYNTLFNFSMKPCLCPGKIKKIVSKIKITYQRDNNIKL